MQLKPFSSHLDCLSIKTCLCKETEEIAARFLAPKIFTGGGCERRRSNTGATGKHQASASETAWKTAAAGAPRLCREIPLDQDMHRNCWSFFPLQLRDPARYGISTQTPPGLCLSWDRGPDGKTATRFGLARGKVRDEQSAEVSSSRWLKTL